MSWDTRGRACLRCARVLRWGRGRGGEGKGREGPDCKTPSSCRRTEQAGTATRPRLATPVTPARAVVFTVTTFHCTHYTDIILHPLPFTATARSSLPAHSSLPAPSPSFRIISPSLKSTCTRNTHVSQSRRNRRPGPISLGRCRTHLGKLSPLLQHRLPPTQQLQQRDKLRLLPLAQALQDRCVHLPGRLHPLRRRQQIRDPRRDRRRRLKRQQRHRPLQLRQELRPLLPARR